MGDVLLLGALGFAAFQLFGGSVSASSPEQQAPDKVDDDVAGDDFDLANIFGTVINYDPSAPEAEAMVFAKNNRARGWVKFAGYFYKPPGGYKLSDERARAIARRINALPDDERKHLAKALHSGKLNDAARWAFHNLKEFETLVRHHRLTGAQDYNNDAGMVLMCLSAIDVSHGPFIEQFARTTRQVIERGEV